MACSITAKPPSLEFSEEEKQELRERLEIKDNEIIQFNDNFVRCPYCDYELSRSHILEEVGTIKCDCDLRYDWKRYFDKDPKTGFFGIVFTVTPEDIEIFEVNDIGDWLEEEII